MNWSPIPPAVAAAVAVAVSVTRRVPAVVMESPIGIPEPRALTLYILGGRFATFALVYGLLLGVAYWVGRGGDAAFVGAGGFERPRVEVDADDRRRAPEDRPECEHPRPRTEVADDPVLDVAVEVGGVDQVGRQIRGRSILFQVDARVLEPSDDRQLLCESRLRTHRLTP